MIVATTERDLELLKFLWKWKVATSAALSKKFFSELRPMTAYHRLWKLQKGGYVTWRSDALGHKFVLHLTLKGFKTIRNEIPAGLKEEGYASEHIGHDLIVSAVHLGDWYFKTPEGPTLISEQQLRRIHPEHLPKEIPSGEKATHCADGYWILPYSSGKKVVALEVELNPKSNAEYQEVSKFYRRATTVTDVLWVVPHKWMAPHIQEQLEKYATEDSHKKHSFVLLDQFKAQCWQAPINNGRYAGLTITHVLGKIGTKEPQNGHKTFCTHFTLDTRKTSMVSGKTKFSQLHDFT